MSRIIGWEDEFKITDGERVITLKDLLPSSHRIFFDQAKHVTLGERKQSLIPEYSDFDDYDIGSDGEKATISPLSGWTALINWSTPMISFSWFFIGTVRKDLER